MTKRQKTIKRIDKKIYQRTAAKTKLVNIEPTPMRGGTRL